MKKYLLLFLVLVPLNIFSQSISLPESLQQCYLRLDQLLSKEDINTLKVLDDPKDMIKYHMSLGLFIRNNWLRHGDQKLTEEINYKPWKIDIDDISGVILTGYWYYLHNQQYEWGKDLDNSEKYYISFDEPENFPEKVVLEKQDEIYTLQFFDYTEAVHVYKDKNENNYYLYIHSIGWIKMKADEYSTFGKAKDKEKIILGLE